MMPRVAQLATIRHRNCGDEQGEGPGSNIFEEAVLLKRRMRERRNWQRSAFL